MTTTASKTGLRAKATATRTKAAQRTPLPPKDVAAKRELAAEAVAEFLHKPEPKSRKAATRTKAAKEERAADKAAFYANQLTALGWKPEVDRLDGFNRLTARRGNESLYIEWLREAHVSGTSTYTIDDRTVKVRNPAEAMRVAARSVEEAKTIHTKTAANKAFRPRETGPSIRNVPFDPVTATDVEVAEALRGRNISWHNQYRVTSETATVGENVVVSRHRGGHRIVSFVDPQFGFRAFRLENLENVGRRVNLTSIRNEILSSLSKGDKAKPKAKAA